MGKGLSCFSLNIVNLIIKTRYHPKLNIKHNWEDLYEKIRIRIFTLIQTKISYELQEL